MTAKNKVAVRIGGKEYTLVGLESDDYMQKIALYIDKKLVDVQKKNPKLNSSMVAVLTSVNVADELFKSVENEATSMEKMRLQIAELTREIEILNKKNACLEKELEVKDMEFCQYKSSYEKLPKVKFYSK